MPSVRFRNITWSIPSCFTWMDRKQMIDRRKMFALLGAAVAAALLKNLSETRNLPLSTVGAVYDLEGTVRWLN